MHCVFRTKTPTSFLLWNKRSAVVQSKVFAKVFRVCLWKYAAFRSELKNGVGKFQSQLSGKIIHCFVSTTDAFATYMNYCRALAFTDLPDYAYLQRLFSGAYAELQLPMVVSFDWDELPCVPKLTFAELHHIPNTPIKVSYIFQWFRDII